MSQTYDVVIVGGGIVGSSAAYHCACEGLRTLLVDRADAGRATDAGAGILAPEMSPRDDPRWSDFEVTAVRYYDVLLKQLPENGAETGYARCGLLLVAVSEDEVEPFDARVARVRERQRQTGWPRSEDLSEQSASQAKEKFPALATVRGALYFRNAARMDGRLFVRALRRAAEGYGLVTIQGSVDRLMISAGRIMGVMAGGSTYHAGSVVIAGGAWSGAFTEQLAIRIPVEPQRGQIIHLQLAGQHTDGWPIVNAFRGHYIVPWPGGRVVVGATRETGSGYDPRVTAYGVQQVLAEALRVAPGLAGAEIHEMRVGLRPLSADMRPVLDRVPSVDGAYLATGHGPAGLQSGPYSGKVMCDLLLGRRAEVDLEPFTIRRFLQSS